MLLAAQIARARAPRGRCAAWGLLARVPWAQCDGALAGIATGRAPREQAPGGGGAPGDGGESGGARRGAFTAPKPRGGKPALSQKVRFVDRLVVEVAGGKGGGGASALFGRTGVSDAGAGAGVGVAPAPLRGCGCIQAADNRT
jgi:hypothetical protein